MSYSHEYLCQHVQIRKLRFLTDDDQKIDASRPVVGTRQGRPPSGDFPRHGAVTRIRDCMHRALNRRAPMCHAGVKRPGTRKWPRTVAAATKPTSARTCLRTTSVHEQWSYRCDINTTTRVRPGSNSELNGGPDLAGTRDAGYPLRIGRIEMSQCGSRKKSVGGRGRSYRPGRHQTHKGVPRSILRYLRRGNSLTLQLMHVVRAKHLETLILRAGIGKGRNGKPETADFITVQFLAWIFSVFFFAIV